MPLLKWTEKSLSSVVATALLIMVEVSSVRESGHAQAEDDQDGRDGHGRYHVKVTVVRCKGGM